jgi:hypothetical protein
MWMPIGVAQGIRQAKIGPGKGYMRLSLAVYLATLAIGILSCDRQVTPVTAVPKPDAEKVVSLTKLESLSKRKGSLLVKDFRSLGELTGPKERTDYYFAKATAVVIAAPGDPPLRGIRIDIRVGQYKESTSFLDEEEAKAVANIIPFMIKYATTQKGPREIVTNLTFRTAGDFTIGVGADRDGDTFAWVESGSVAEATHRFKPENLARIKKVFESGIEWLKDRQPSIPDSELRTISAR